MILTRTRFTIVVLALALVMLLPSLATLSAQPARPAQPAPPASKTRLFPPTDLGLLETPDRDDWNKPDLIMDTLGIADGAVVADLGAGGGWFTVHLAQRVGPNGIVYAQDIQSEMIEAISRRVQNAGFGNVRTVMGTPTDPRLPSGIDVAVIVDAYREMDEPARPEQILTLFQNVRRALKPQGRLGVVDFLPGDGGPGPAAADRINPEAVIKVAQAAGFQLQSRHVIPPFQMMLVFTVSPTATTAPLLMTHVPTALTIAGSDSGGGAGIQADLKTFAAHGVYGTSAIAAITAQNTVAVTTFSAVDADLVIAQIEAVAADIAIHATKTGMLASAAIVEAVAATIKELSLPNLVVDPVMVAKSGDRLLNEDAVQMIQALLLPQALVVTPNIPEAEVLSGRTIHTLDDAREAARALHAMGPTAVVIKGGHSPGDEIVDLLFDGRRFSEFRVPRVVSRNTHGTGCTFASAIAARLALGATLDEAVAGAQAYVAGGIRHALAIGHGHGPLDHFWGGILAR